MSNNNDILIPKEGKGVSKQKKQKRAIFLFFELFQRKFWDLIKLNLIYILFCLPIITFGPATAAMTKILRYYYEEKPVFLFNDFVKAFKENFKQSFFVGIIDILFIIAFVLYTKFFLPDTAVDTQDGLKYALILLVTVIFLLANFYIYVQIVTLTLKMPAIIKNSIYFVFLSIVPNFVSLSVFVISFTLVLLFLPYSLIVMILIGFSFIGLVVVFNTYRVIYKIIIKPYYEAKGEKTPLEKNLDNEDAIFTDVGEQEPPAEKPIFTGKAKGKGKVIK